MTIRGRTIPIAAPTPDIIEVLTANKKMPAYISIRIIKPSVIGLLIPLAIALSIDELIILRLISEAQIPKANPYGKTMLIPITGNETTTTIAATTIVAMVISFLIALIVLPSFFEITPHSMLVL